MWKEAEPRIAAYVKRQMKCANAIVFPGQCITNSRGKMYEIIEDYGNGKVRAKTTCPFGVCEITVDKAVIFCDWV